MELREKHTYLQEQEFGEFSDRFAAVTDVFVKSSRELLK